ncbi:copper amine oxidase [Listeria booriae]|uniref:Copper amine oxidase n=1 Tax=Listeria booriae TaxID=1552123 RepID=A0A841Y107_9LIST|nr:copper amine oxidase [Listeria booriae]MBC1373151.1 copper amine oxidase [Listeria booriae]
MKMRKWLTPVLGLALIVSPVTGAYAAETAPTVKTPASDLRATFDYLLSEHYALAVDTMIKTYDGNKAAPEAAKALDQNAKDMEPAIASIYGEEGGKQFEAIFAPHNAATDDYAKAVKDGDKTAQDAATKEVDKFVNDMAAFLSTATGGKLPEAGAKQALAEHEADVQQVFDQYVAKDYEGAYKTYLAGFEQIFGAGKAISGAIVAQNPDKFENTKPDTAAADLRSALTMLGSEHFALATLSMEKGYDGDPDYDYVNWAQDQNTAAFKAAFTSIYGADAGNQFEKLWTTNHINAQADLAAATAAKNTDNEQKDKTRLTNTFANDFGNFLATATDGNLPAKDAIAALTQHETTVTDTFNKYVSADYAGSYASYREGYKLMSGIGENLGGAIVTQFPDKFSDKMPTSMPNTGMGDGEQTNHSFALWFGLSAIILAGAGFIIFRQQKQQRR